MPDPCAYADEADFHSACVAARQEEDPGEAIAQSNAACYAMWRDRDCPKAITATLTKASGAERDAVFVLSEESPDRVGDVIEVAGWDLRNFKRNPVALWQHNAEKPIGTWQNIRIEGKRLLGDLKLASTNLAKMARQLIDDGVLRAVSVGFKPLEYEPIDKDDKWGERGLRFKAAELLEVSLVSVPAHPRALLLSKSLRLSAEERRLVFGPSLRRKTAVSGTHPAIHTAQRDLEHIRRVLGKQS